MIEQLPQTTRGPSEGRRPIVVLLVDDQRFVGAAVGQLLGAEPDIALHCCLQAVDAIAMANQIVPNVVLQDLVMPTRSVDTSGVVAGFGGHTRGRPPRSRTGIP